MSSTGNSGMISGVSEKIIHFGEFIRWHRVRAGKTTEALGRETSLTARRLIAIEAMAKPDVQHTTMAALAKAFGFDPDGFDQVWKTTPVPVTRRKRGPSTDEATRFATACRAVGILPIEGARRLRSWLVEQDAQTQMAALSFVPEHRREDEFTQAVDHLQDPAEAVQDRLGRQADQSAKSPESAATSENTHR